MKLAGAILLTVGAIVLVLSFALTTTVDSTYNLGLLQQQMMVFQTALITIAGGAIFLAGGRSFPWDAHADEGESDEERDVRIAQNRQRNSIAAGVCVGVFLIGVVAGLASAAASRGRHPSDSDLNTMTVDENLTTLDMNATDMNATDMNAIDLNASGFVPTYTPPAGTSTFRTSA